MKDQRLKDQNKRLLRHLRKGKTINFIRAYSLGICFLHSRIADLRKDTHIYDKWVIVNGVRCKEYSLKELK